MSEKALSSAVAKLGAIINDPETATADRKAALKEFKAKEGELSLLRAQKATAKGVEEANANIRPVGQVRT